MTQSMTVALSNRAGAARHDRRGVLAKIPAEARPHGGVVEAGIECLVPVIADEDGEPAGLRAHVVVDPPEDPATNDHRIPHAAFQHDAGC